MTIGIDIDDTITETSKMAAEYLKKYEPTYTNYHDLPLEKYEEYMRLFVDDILSTVSLKPNVKESLEYLKGRHHQIIFITARNNKYSHNTETVTLEYLKKYHIPYDNIIFNQHYKGEAARKNHVDLFIDDKISVLEEVSKCGIECLHMGTTTSHFPSFTNWVDILEYLKKKEGF